MLLLMMVLSFWAEDPAYVVNEENCKFEHFIELPNDSRISRLLKACFKNLKDEPKPGGGRLQEKTVRPLKELMNNPVNPR